MQRKIAWKIEIFHVSSATQHMHSLPIKISTTVVLLLQSVGLHGHIITMQIFSLRKTLLLMFYVSMGLKNV